MVARGNTMAEGLGRGIRGRFKYSAERIMEKGSTNPSTLYLERQLKE